MSTIPHLSKDFNTPVIAEVTVLMLVVCVSLFTAPDSNNGPCEYNQFIYFTVCLLYVLGWWGHGRSVCPVGHLYSVLLAYGYSMGI